jgi:hypothetical protein
VKSVTWEKNMTDTAPLFITLTVTTLEDFHAGSGTGGGDIDALVQRDGHNKPVIRASHFKGLLREASEELIALGTLTQVELDNLLGAGGGNGRGELRLTSLFIPKGEAGKTLVWGSTQRAENKRQPEPDTLRFIEHVAAGTRFKATLRLANAALLPLVERLLNRIDRIGGNRNRGGGLVKLDWRSQPAPRSFQPSPLTGKGQNLRLVLRNLEPLCLPSTGYPGNLICTHSFIRGQTLRGALIAWAIHNGRADHINLFERISVGDALPLPAGCRDAAQVLPIPLSILTDKPSGGTVNMPWWAGKTAPAKAFDSFGEMPEAEEKRKRPNAHEYLCRTADNAHWQCYKPQMQVRLRNATPKRDSTDDTQLFSLEEIAENTYFQTELRCADQKTADQFLRIFAPLLIGEMVNRDWLALGRGGQPVQIEMARTAAAPASPKLGDDWTLTLTSDAIVRGERLGFVDNLSKELLCQLAGIDCQTNWEIAAAVAETNEVHGFNAVTGLPRTPALALRRGSCWRITGAGSSALVKALLKKGILGERAAEGYGRFVIGLQPIDSDKLGKPAGKPAPPVNNRHEELLALAREIAAQINDNGPSVSQLQWLRSQATALSNAAQLTAALDEIRTAAERRPQGGKAWANFPHQPLQTALGNCGDLAEKCLLINYLVQWRVRQLKSKSTSQDMQP